VRDEKKEQKVRVVDRRRFDERGDLKDPSPPAVAAPVQPPAPAPPPQAPTESQAAVSEAEALPTKVGFLDLVDFLAQQAVALLSGQVPGRGRDPVAARFFIDLLGVVQEKTGGQLAPEENRYLEDILYQLRSLFVAATR
jgi:hypothetical protein